MVTTYDVVADLGFDDTGSTANDTEFDNNIGDNVTFEFPPGTYAFDSWDTYYYVDNFTMRGTGDNHRDAVIQPLTENNGSNRFGNFVGTNHSIENLTFNAYDNDKTDITVWMKTEDQLFIDKVEFWGRFPDSDHTGSQLNAEITTSSGSGTIQRLALGTKFGGVQNDYPNHRGLTITGNHVGTLTVDRMRAEDFGGSAIRNTHVSGPVILENSYFENVYNAAIRVNATPDNTARNCEVKITESPTGSDTLAADGIRVDGEDGSCTGGGLIEDCDVIVESAARTLGGIVNRGFSDVTDVEVRNCRVEYNNDSASALQINQDECSGYWTVKDSAFTGTGTMTVNEKSGTLERCCFPSGADLSDWSTSNTSTSGGCDSPNFTLMSGGFWPSTTTTISPTPILTRNGNAVTVSGAISSATALPNYSNQVDAFEDGDISEYFDDTGSWIVETDSSFATVGNNVLRSDTTDISFSQILSTSGLNQYPDDSSDVYRVDAWAGDSDTAQAGTCYRVQDVDNMWRARISSKNDALKLRKRQNGSTSTFAQASVTINPGNRYTLEMDPTSGGTDEFVARVYDGDGSGTALASLTSDTFLSGNTGIGFMENNVGDSAEYVRFDNARIA